MLGSYDLNGNIFIKRDNGEIVKLNYVEAIEVFATLSDVIQFDFDRDSIVEEIEEKLLSHNFIINSRKFVLK